MTAKMSLAAVVVLGGPAVLFACDSDKYNNYGYVSPFPSPTTTGTGTGYPAQQIPPSPCESAVADTSCNDYDTYNSLVCEVGSSPNVACNQTLECDRYYMWKQTSGGEACPNACPSAYTLTAPPGTCEVPNAGRIICEYQEGTCGCAPADRVKTGTNDAGVDASDGGDAGNIANSDAGPTVYQWTCVKPDTGCPRTRPRLGTRCVRPMTCDYGACLFEDGIAVTCTRGYSTGTSSSSGYSGTSSSSGYSGTSSGGYYYDYGSYWTEDTASGCRRTSDDAGVDDAGF